MLRQPGSAWHDRGWPLHPVLAVARCALALLTVRTMPVAVATLGQLWVSTQLPLLRTLRTRVRRKTVLQSLVNEYVAAAFAVEYTEVHRVLEPPKKS